jgi:atypical dual specificity phosphatase
MHASLIIDKRLFIGSCPMDADDVEQLKAAGVTAVISLQTDDDLEQRDINWAAMENEYRRQGIVVNRWPITDFSPSDLRKKLRGCVRLLDNLIRTGNVVYLHCNAGINRSPTAAVAYLHWIEGWDLRSAHAHVVRCRPCDPYVEEILLAPAE